MGFILPGDDAGEVPGGTPPQSVTPTPGLGGRAEYGAEQSNLAEKANAGFDPPAITDRTNFASWDHPALKSAADTLDAGAMSELASAWIDRGQYLTGDMRAVGLGISSAIGGGWTGPAAEHATAASTAYAARGEELGAAMMVTGAKLSTAADAASAAKAAVPPPAPVDPTHAMIVGSMNPQNPMAAQMDLEAQNRAAEDARLRAVDAMERVYAPGYVESDAQVPVLPPPTTPAGAGPGGGGAGGGGTVTGRTGGDGLSTGRPDVGLAGSGAARPAPAARLGCTHPRPRPTAVHLPIGRRRPLPHTRLRWPVRRRRWRPRRGPTARWCGWRARNGGHRWRAGVIGRWRRVGSRGRWRRVGSRGRPGPESRGGQSGAVSGPGFGPSSDRGATVSAPTGSGAVSVTPASAMSGMPGGAAGFGAGSPSANGDYIFGPRSGYGTGMGSSPDGTAGGYRGGGTAAGYGATGSGAGVRGGYDTAPGARSGSGAGGSSTGSGAGRDSGSGMGRGATSGVGPGASGAASEGAVAARGAGASGGGRGAGGMGGMGAGGRGRGDDDYEHDTPSYLITEEHGSEIVGDLPPTSPPVIGA